MSFPSTILDALVELELNGTRTDITPYVFGNPETGKRITLSIGRSAEGWQVDPAHAELELDNRDGRFSPRNPRSPYYGLLSRNTPLHISVKPHLTDVTTGIADLTDTFSRTVAAGDTWGTADTGQTWSKSTASAANKLSVSGGTGRILMSTANTTVRVVTDLGDYMDHDTYVTFTSPVATGATLVPMILTSRRYNTGGANGGVFQVFTTTAGVVGMQVVSNSISAVQLGATVVAPITHTGQALRIRVRFAGTTTMGKCWDPAATAEPADWQIVRTDTSTYLVAPSGAVAIACNAPTGNTNVPFTAQYDDVSIVAIEPRFAGQVADLPVRWTPGAPSTGAVWSPIEAGGALRRLNDQRARVASALERYLRLSATVPKGYWTLGDAGKVTTTSSLALAAGSTIGSGSPTWIGLVTGFADGSDQSGKLGQGSFNGGWLPNGVSLGGDTTGDQVLMDFTQVPYDGTAGWAVDWVRTGPKVSGAQIEAFHFDMTGYLAGEAWTVTLDQATTSAIITDPNGVTHSTSLAATSIFNGEPHMLRFQVLPDSATTLRYRFYLDGVNLVNATMTPTDFNGAGKHYFWQIAQTDPATPVTYGHLILWDGASPPSALAVATAALGYAGEATDDRIARLAVEEGLAYRMVRQVTEPGETLGPQAIGTAYDALKQAADADGGLLYDLPDALGIGYRVRATMYSQGRQLALTYSTDGHLDPPLEPTDDLTHVLNSASVTRQYGGLFTAELASGTLSVQPPPSGIGVYDGAVTLALASDDVAQNAAEWRVAVGTVDEARWPAIRMSLAHLLRHGLTTLAVSLLRTVVGDRLDIASPPSFLPPGDIDQLVQGWSETIDQHTWALSLVGAPAAPYRIGLWNGAANFYAGRWDVDDATLAASATSSDTSLSVASPSTLWTTTAGDFPFDVNISGVRITVTNITGAASPQTFTVTRSTDGFDIALAAGAKVSLWRPMRWGW